jgi:hypothetical protein
MKPLSSCQLIWISLADSKPHKQLSYLAVKWQQLNYLREWKIEDRFGLEFSWLCQPTQLFHHHKIAIFSRLKRLKLGHNGGLCLLSYYTDYILFTLARAKREVKCTLLIRVLY